ncbi:hypothetical protein [Leptospira bourretii]|nr:hypothetical protein [Leptospira bourretii]
MTPSVFSEKSACSPRPKVKDGFNKTADLFSRNNESFVTASVSGVTTTS